MQIGVWEDHVGLQWQSCLLFFDQAEDPALVKSFSDFESTPPYCLDSMHRELGLNCALKLDKGASTPYTVGVLGGQTQSSARVEPVGQCAGQPISKDG